MYIKKIYRFVSYRVPGRELAEDLTQEVFTDLLAFFKRTDHYIEYVKALIYTIARHKIAGYYEKHGKVRMVELFDSQLSEDEEKNLMANEINLEKEIDQKENIKLLMEEFNVWNNEEFKEIITLRFIEQLSHREIAKILGKSEGNVRVITHRAVQELKKKLKNKLKK